MARPKKNNQANEQLALIDVGPENMKDIAPVARQYKDAQARRIAALDEEVTLKQQIRELVAKAQLKRLADGKIRFRCDGLLIEITPRDEKVTVKDEAQEKE
jgi:hypothetical protein